MLATASRGNAQLQNGVIQSLFSQRLNQVFSSRDVDLLASLQSGSSAVSVAIGNVLPSGKRELITGYSAGQRGALTIQEVPSIGFQNLNLNPTVVPIPLPVQPSLMTTARVSGHSHDDVVVGSKGTNSLYVLQNDGQGNLGSPRALAVRGKVGALSSWTSADARTYVVAADCSNAGSCGLELVPNDQSANVIINLGAEAKSVETVSVNGGKTQDLVVLTANGISIVDGDTILSSSPSVTNISVSSPVAMATGLFAYDRRAFRQIAILGSDAMVRVYARAGADTSAVSRQDVQSLRNAARHGTPPTTGASPRGLSWTQAEVVNSTITSPTSASMSAGRFTGSGFDDLVLLNSSNSVKIAHPVKVTGKTAQTTPVVSAYQSGTTNHTTGMTPVQGENSSGWVSTDGQARPLYQNPNTSQTYTVNTTSDVLDDLSTAGRCVNSEASCSLRDAIGIANQNYAAGVSGVNVISVPAGTYKLSRDNGTPYDSSGSVNIHLDIDAPVSLVGAGQGATIIDGNGVDKIFSVNSGIVNPLSPIDVSFSQLTLQNGANKNDPASEQCNAGCDYFGGILDFEADGPGELKFSSVTLSGGKALQSSGGALFATNTPPVSPTGLIEFDGSTIAGSSSPEQGAGLWIGNNFPVTLQNDTINSNTADPSVNPADPQGTGDGGGVYLQGGSNSSVLIQSTTFSKNAAKDSGGGLFATSIGPQISASTFSGNSASGFGAGLYLDNQGYPASVFSTQFVSNTLSGSSGQNSQGPYPSNGAGVCVEGSSSSSTAPAVIQYSRFFGNTGGHTNGLAIGCMSPNSYATVGASENWWGCNGAATGSGCDAASNAFPKTASLTVSPSLLLTLQFSTTSPALGSTFTAIGSLGQDSSGTKLSQGNAAALIGTPSSLTITQPDRSQVSSGTVNLSSTAAPAVSYAAVATSATATAVGTGTATVQVDNASVSQSFSVQKSATAVTFAQPPAATVTAGGNAGTVQVALVDSTGATVTSDSSTVVTLVVSGPNSYSQSYSGRATNGVATFSLGAASLTAVGSYTYTARVPNLTTASVTETVVAAGVSTFEITGLGTVPAPAVSETALVTAVDAYKNVVPNFNGTVALSSTDGTATYSPASYTFTQSDHGSHTFTVTFNTAGIQTLTATGAGATGADVGIVVQDAIWVLNQSNQAVRLTSAGAQTTVAGPDTGMSPYGGIAFDNAGNVWVTQLDSSTFAKYSPTGTPLIASSGAGGIYQPTAIAIDGLGQAWIANSGNKSVSVVSNAGAAISPSTGLQTGNLASPTGIAIDSSGSVWITVAGAAAPVIKIIGAAAPVITPLATGTANKTLGTRP